MEMLLSFPPAESLPGAKYDHSVKAHIKALEKVEKRLAGQPDLLDAVNPSINTVSYAFVLAANVKADRGLGGDDFFQRAALFLQTFDPIQIRYVGPQLLTIIEVIATDAQQSPRPDMAVVSIRDALTRLDPSGHTFTSAHILLVKLALTVHVLDPVQPVLDKHILYFPGMNHNPLPEYTCNPDLPSHQWITSRTGFVRSLRYQDVLEYFLLAGTIYIGLGEWARAIECLEQAITFPSRDNAISRIMVEAYKKWVLVNLLLHGKTGSLPATTNTNASKVYHTLAKPYDTLAQLFENAPAPRLKAEADHGTSLWQEDGNYGLVMEVLAAFQTFQIRNLANVYSSISIPEINKMTLSAETGRRLPSNQETESLVQSMIDTGVLKASLVRTPGAEPVLSFDVTSSSLSEAEVQSQLTDSISRVAALIKDLKASDRRLLQTKEYLKFAHGHKKTGNKEFSLEAASVIDQIEDEDLMGGSLM